MLITSFYTVGTLYEESYPNLKKSLDKFGLSYDINGVYSQGNWKANCRYRAEYLIQMMEKHNDSVLWLDIDAVVLKYPELLLNLPEDIDLAWYNRNGKEILLGTSYWKNTSAVKGLLRDWYNTCDPNTTAISQRDFMRLLGSKYNGKFNIGILPESYCHIFDYPNITEEPYIVHNQLSRKTKKFIAKDQRGDGMDNHAHNRDGVVYVATAKEPDGYVRLLRELSRSLRSLKHFNIDIKTCLIASPNIIEHAKHIVPLFDHVVTSQYPEFDGTILSKLQALELSPFRYSCLLDVDTIILGDIQPGFLRIREHDMALAIDAEQEDGDITIFNKGVIFVHKNDATHNVFSRIINAKINSGSYHDFRLELSREIVNNKIKIYPLSYFWNVRPDHIGFHPVPLDKRDYYSKLRIIHTHYVKKESVEFVNNVPGFDRLRIVMSGMEPVVPVESAITNTRKKIYLPLNVTGWAFDVRCTALERHLLPFYDIKKVQGIDVAKKGIGFEADLVYFPTYESIDRFGAHCNRFCATIGGLVIRTLDESIDHFGRALAIAVPNKTWFDQYVAKELPIKFFLIPNGVNTDVFVPASRNNGKIIAGWVGNDRPDRAKIKRLDDLRNACQRLGITLLEQKRSEALPHDKMPEFYQKIDLYINLSVTEGSNNCLLEAAACGVPIMGTPVGNIPELKEYGAWEVDYNLSDLEEKLLAFCNLSSSERYQIGDNLREAMVSHYSSKCMAMKYKDMFDYCLNI